MDIVFQKIHEAGIVPVVKIDAPGHAIALSEALLAGDIPVVEITFRTSAAEESIRRISSELPEMLVGAGTVISPDQAELAMKAGAQFIVSPGFNEPVVDYCLEQGIPVIPGVNSPSQVEQGLHKGLKVLKFFPAEASGGTGLLKAIAAPYKDVRFIPTGGIKTENMNEYLSSSRVLAIGGSWMVNPTAIAGECFDEITRISREAVMTMLGFALEHVGVNTPDAGTAREAVSFFEAFFPGRTLELEKSYMVPGFVEFMKGHGRGITGHIAVGTSSIPRAIAYLRRHGIEVDTKSTVEQNGIVKAIFLKDEIGGIAVHLFQR